jgi:large conductance mechanosensitive channel
MTAKPKQTSVKADVIATREGVQVVQRTTHRRKGVTVLLDSDDILREQVGGFANFIREYAVVGLAVGFIVGQQANSVMKQLVTSFVDPWLRVLFGPALATRTAVLHHGRDPVQMPWGAFLYAIIEFFFVAVAIYLVVKLLRLDKLKKQ